jgi:hypothetical protein
VPCAALFAALLLPTTLTAQAGTGTLRLFEHANFGGTMIPFPIPPTTNNQIGSLGSFGDRTSSLQWLTLPPHIAVCFYENTAGSGARYAIAHDAVRTGSVPNVGATYNDTFSSFSTHYEVPSHGLLRMWDGANQTMWTLRRASAARFHERCDRSSPTRSFDAIPWRGTGAWSVAVPNDQALLGVTLWLQSASSSSSWKLSNGLRAILGVP